MHSHLQLEDRSPLLEGQSNRPHHLGVLIEIPQLRIHNKIVDVKRKRERVYYICFIDTGHVERYLEKTFYDHTALALHDWQTYEEMRALARHKYGMVRGIPILYMLILTGIM
jgi:hypothetical protein